MEKSGTFENATGCLQSFKQAIRPKRWSKSEAQIGIDLLAVLRGEPAGTYCDATTRQSMAEAGLNAMSSDVQHPSEDATRAESDMHLIVL